MKTFIVQNVSPVQGEPPKVFMVKAEFAEISDDRMLCFYDAVGGEMVAAFAPWQWSSFLMSGPA